MSATIQNSAIVQIDYVLTVDGSVVDSSQESGPLSYTHGAGQILPALEKELDGKQAGFEKELVFTPKNGYGEIDPKAFSDVGRDQIPPSVTPQVGMVLEGRGPDDQTFAATIHEVKGDTITLNFNHPLAGKTLHFKVKVVSVSIAEA